MVNFMKADDIKRLSKSLSLIENGGSKALALLKKSYAEKKSTPILGITGLPGAGKSTLVDHLIQLLRGEGKTVAVLAVDPSSPFSGGALLGDRVRMQRHATDEGVFIRSLASRGAHGGLSRAARDLTVCLDAFGFDQIIVETVGVGQTELDIMGLATTTVVVLVPESGDTIQTIKAGLMEIADIFVVNKSDLQGAENLKRMIKAMFEIPVLLTQADKGGGITELWEAIEKHRAALKKDPGDAAHRQALRRAQFLELCGDAAKQKLQQQLTTDKKWKAMLEQVASEKLNPYEALEKVLENVAGDGIEPST